MLRKLDFTFHKYRELCETIIRSEYNVVTVSRYLSDPGIRRLNRVVMLRHDVDTRPENALYMGALEHELGLQATYYFRMVPSTYRPSLIKTLRAQGHEIGYHYETLYKARGDFARAIRLFERELTEMRQLCQIKTACMHGSSISPWDNRSLWERYDFRDFGLIGECYLSLDYNRVIYRTDTGRTWGESRANIRDRVTTNETLPGIVTTHDLIGALKAAGQFHWLLQAHPNKWARSFPEWQYSLMQEWLINLAKPILVPAVQRAHLILAQKLFND